LISEAGRGDRGAIGRLLERHLPALRAYVRLRGGPRVRRQEGDSDVVQSVCLELLRGLENFRYRGEAAFRHWLFTAALRKLVAKDRYWSAEKRDVRRLVSDAKSSSSGTGSLEEVYATFLTPSQVAIGRETRERIERALDALPEDPREIILMSRLMGLSHAEIAQHLGRSEPAVRSTLSRALARLARLLATSKA
jgi:RNA polymerase sigma-70 factor (ECF subfamily)